MTAALGDLTQPIFGASTRVRSARVVTALAIALPVPVCAALGLSLPLPATVERLAAKLVPFDSSGAFDTAGARALAHGSIVLAPGEQRFTRTGSTSPSRVSRLSVVLAGHGSSRNATPVGPAVTQPTGPTSGVSDSVPTTVANRPGAPAVLQPSGGSSPTPSNGGEQPPNPGGTQPGPSPAPSPVETVTPTANAAVGSATSAAGGAASAATGAVGSAAGAATGTVGGIHPP